MSVEKNVPQIRFKDFAGEWLDTTLSDVIDVRSGKDYKHLGKGNIPVYGTGGYMLSVDSALSNDEDAIGIGRKGTIDKPYLLRAPFWTVDTLFYAVPKPKFKLDYLYCLFQKIDWKKHDESTGVPSLSKVAINNIPVRVTSETEQTAIGNTFQKLDNLINQHQQKHDKLSNIKKAMLEKMFPKQGETMPEIRFKGFSGEWEESTLAEEAVVTTGYPFDSADFSEDGDLLVVTNGNIQNSSSAVDGKVGNRIASEKVTHLNQYKLNFGDILVTMDGSVGRTAKVIERNQILAQRVGRLVARNDTEFLYQSLNTGAFLETMTTISHGGTIKHISLSEIGSYIVQVPKDLNEQAKIGAYLKNLDDLIERHHKQITKLNNIKQACLSKMFV